MSTGKRVHGIVAAAIFFAMTPVHALEIAVRQISSDSFQVRLTNDTTIGEREAQVYVGSAATSLCKDRVPVLGKYTFSSSAPLGSGPTDPSQSTFRFTQDVSCIPVTMAPPTVAMPAIPLVVDEKKTEAEIRSKTESFFRLLSDDRIDDAYEEMSKTHKAWDEAAWKTEKRDFRSKAGKPNSITVVKITLYQNPAEAPEPGLYVAADYSNEYENVPIQCGYLMWFRTASGQWEITRDEMGFATSEELRRIPPEQVPALRQQLRCVAPENGG